MPSEYEIGMLTGLLVGEGHFGGDGRQPQITLRMHVRHEALFRWIESRFPGGRLYGPYDHGGRRYFQWMARGAYLRNELVPMLAARLSPDLDGYAFQRFEEMRRRYARFLGSPPTPTSPQAGTVVHALHDESDVRRRGEAGSVPPLPDSPATPPATQSSS